MNEINQNLAVGMVYRYMLFRLYMKKTGVVHKYI